MYYIKFNANGEQISFCNGQENKLPGQTYYNAPANFNPLTHFCTLVGGAIIINNIDVNAVELARQKSIKIRELEIARDIVLSSFTSLALGTPHTYDSDAEKNQNLIGLVAIGVDTTYGCYDQNGVKYYPIHTAAQFKQVVTDGSINKQTAIMNYINKKASVEAATTIVAVQAINW